jgi:hypothetical protein
MAIKAPCNYTRKKSGYRLVFLMFLEVAKIMENSKKYLDSFLTL